MAVEPEGRATARQKGLAFESLCQRKLESDGYVVETTPITRDGGIDLIARRRDLTGESLVLVQCKDYQQPVGVDELRRFLGAARKHPHFARLVFAAGSGLTVDATKEARESDVTVWTRAMLEAS